MKHEARSEAGYTYGDYLEWSDDERWELINGHAYAMTPAPSRTHQRVVGELHRQIANFLHGHSCEVYVAPFDIRLPREDESDRDVDTVVQPDISVICDEKKLDERGCRGGPDWIIEILSPSTAVKDQIHKRQLYAEHGVKEYWLVHPVDRLVTIYRLERDGYASPDIMETRGQTESSTIPGLAIDWDQPGFPSNPGSTSLETG